MFPKKRSLLIDDIVKVTENVMGNYLRGVSNESQKCDLVMFVSGLVRPRQVKLYPSPVVVRLLSQYYSTVDSFSQA